MEHITEHPETEQKKPDSGAVLPDQEMEKVVGGAARSAYVVLICPKCFAKRFDSIAHSDTCVCLACGYRGKTGEFISTGNHIGMRPIATKG